MFFDKFPTTHFDITSKDKIVVTDFIRAIKLDPKLKSDNMFFYEYTAKDGETPEIISHRAYKTTQYHWVIMLLNEKFDPWNDFPQLDSVLQKRVIETYGSLNVIHHYEDSLGNVVDEFYYERTPVTVIENARKENDAKRQVKILKLEVLSEFVSQYEQLIQI